MSQPKQLVDLTKDTSHSWLERGCLAREVLGITPVESDKGKGSVICAVVEIDNSSQKITGPSRRKELLPTSYLRKKVPQLLIQFYEKRIDTEANRPTEVDIECWTTTDNQAQ